MVRDEHKRFTPWVSHRHAAASSTPLPAEKRADHKDGIWNSIRTGRLQHRKQHLQQQRERDADKATVLFRPLHQTRIMLSSLAGNQQQLRSKQNSGL